MIEIIEDLGMRYPSDTSTRKRRYAKFRCHCGVEFIGRMDLISNTKSCGCARNQVRIEIPIGEIFDRLIIEEDLGIKENNYRERFVKAKCDCGNVLIVSWSSIKKGNTKSCGCLHKERASESCREVGKIQKHGMDGTKIYKIWCGMRHRCYIPTTTSFERYGGRGISVCKEWIDSFESFYDWAIKNGYKEGLSIDRIDNDGDYEPSNCQWLTLSQNTKKMHEDKKKKVNIAYE